MKLKIENWKIVNYRRGFTLIETLIALSIFTVSIVGLMAILSSGIADINYGKRKITAAYLAQEGIEYARNIRDTYVLYSSSGQVGWNAFVNKMTEPGAVCQEQNGCYIDNQAIDYGNQTQPMTGVFVIACGSSCAPILYNESTGKYNYVSGGNSGFVRKIRVTTINANEIQILSTVFWNQDSGAYQVTFSESLYNWVE